MSFTGFSPEAIDFLWGIRLNNNRDWFLPHKQDYVTYLYEPMKALGADLFEPYWEKPGMVLKVSRIYRDARLHHPDPYKESLWLSIRREVPWWGEYPCLYFEIRPEGISYGFGLYAPRLAAVDRFRKEIAARPRAFQELIRKTEADTGLPVTAELYKKPKPTDNPELTEFFRWKGSILCVRREEVGPEIFGPELEDRVADLFSKVTPLYDFFDCVLTET